MRKSYYQQLLMVALKKILNFFGLRPIRNVVFFAPVNFHLQHLMPVIDVLKDDQSIRVYVVKTPGFAGDPSIEKDVVLLEREAFEKMYWKIHDVVVTTELDFIPYWFGIGKRIGMFHGAGPKKGYLERMTGKEFDYIFSPGPFVHQLQLKILGELVGTKTEVIPVGLPSIDVLNALNYPREKLLQEKPTVLYAPSWHWDQNMVSMDEDIIKILSSLDAVHVVIRPHPNLLNPSRNDNVDWGRIIEKYESADFVLSKHEPINELLIQADIIVGDISSVMYEFLVLDRPGILYAKTEILEASIYAEAIKPLTDAYERIDDASQLEGLLSACLAGHDVRQEHRRLLKESTFYNIGFSASIAAKEIAKITRM